MAEKGGQTTQAGIDYQNKIAALFLGRMIDPGPWPKNEEIIEVRNEDPSAEVDDIVLRYPDHVAWIQVKLNMSNTGETWIKFWKYMFAQRWGNFSQDDRLVLAISKTPDWVKDLEEICGKARGSRKSLELATLEQQVKEWDHRLSEKQKFLINAIVEAVSGKKELKKKSDDVSTVVGSKEPDTGNSMPSEHLQPEALFELFSHLEVWLQFNPDKIKSDHGRSYMPKATLEWSDLFDKLFRIAGDNARYGKSISRSELIQELKQNKIFIIGSTSLIPFAAGLSKQYVHRRGIEIPLIKCLRRKPDDSVPVVIGLVGNGGFGKTGLAKAAANDPRVLKKYPDGVLWVELGQTPDLRNIIENQIRALTGKSPGFVGLGETGLNEAATVLADELRRRKMLIVLDDVWQKKHLEYFQAGALQSVILVTTRLSEIVPPKGILNVNEMENREAVRLLVSWMEAPPQDMDPFSSLAKKLGEWPLLIELAASSLKESVEVDGLTLIEAMTGLQDRLNYYGFTAFDRTDEKDRMKAISINMNVSLERLEKLDRLGNVRPRYLELAVFPEGEEIPFSTIEKLWKATAGMERIPVEDTLQAMHRLSLFYRYDARGRTVRLHDVIRNYLEEQVKDDLPLLNGKLLDGYGLRNWTEMPANEPHLWRWLATHLWKAGRNAELYRLIDRPWMNAKLSLFKSHQPFAADVEIAIQAAKEEKPPNIVQLIRGCLIYATLGTLATNAPPQALWVLAKYGKAEKALGYAALIQDASKKSEAYHLIGEALFELKKPEAGKTALHQALAAAQAIQDEGSKAWALSNVAGALAQAGLAEDASQAARQVLAVVQAIEDERKKVEAMIQAAGALAQAGFAGYALTAAQAIQDEWYKAQALSDVSWALAQAGLAEDAGQAARQALAAVQAIQDEWDKAPALSVVAGALAKAGLAEDAGQAARQALVAAQSIQDEGDKARALSQVAGELAQAGLAEDLRQAVRQALAAAQAIQDEGYKAEALSEVAWALAQVKDRDGLLQALKAAQAIQNEGYMEQALSGVVGMLAQAGLAKQALKAAKAVQDEWTKAQALSEVARTLAQAGLAEQALEAAQAIQDEGSKAWALSNVAGALAQAGLAEQALAAAKAIQDKLSKAQALSEVARSLAQAGLVEDADQAATQALEAAQAIQDGGSKAQALSEVARALAQAGLAEYACQVAEQARVAAQAIQGERSKARALREVAEALAQAGLAEETGQTARQALVAAQAIQDKWSKAEALNGVAWTSAQAGLAEEAGQAARQARVAAQAIQGKRSKAWALSDVAWALAQAGLAEDAGQAARQALVAARAIQDEWSKAWALSQVAGALAQAGLAKDAHQAVRQALRATQAIQDEWYKAQALIEVAKALAHAGLAEDAGQAARQALATARSIQDEGSKAQALSWVAAALAQAGLAKQALKAAKAVQDEGFKAQALNEVARTLAQAGLAEQALEAAQAFQEEWSKAQSLSEVAWALAQAELAEDAGKAARQALKAARAIQDKWSKAWALSGVAGALAQAGLAEEAGQAVRQTLEATQAIQDERYRAQALTGVARALDRIGDSTQALDIYLQAFQIARLAGREAEFNAIGQGASALAAKDDGQTLWKVYEAILKVDAWWQV